MKGRIAPLLLAGLLAVWPGLAMAHQAAVLRAAERFDLEPRLIEAVIQVESGGDRRAVSPAGAMGLMQLMPGTWSDLRSQLGLGDDPFDPEDNVLAGTAYLRWLLDRYGREGFLSAYNAGPGRYKQSLSGRPLPPETVAYVAKLRDRFAGAPGSADWRAAGLFPPAWSARWRSPPQALFVERSR